MEIIAAELRNPNLPNEEKYSLIDFAVRTFEYLVGSESVVRMYLLTILENVVSIGYDGDLRVWNSLQKLAQSAQARKEFISAVVADFFVGEFGRATDEQRRKLAIAIDGGHINSANDEGVTRIEPIDRNISQGVIDRILPYLAASAGENQLAAELLFEWSAKVPAAALRKFGIEYLYGDRVPLRGVASPAWARRSSGFGRIDHAAMAGSVTRGSSLNCATLSSVM